MATETASRWAGVALSFALALVGALAYMHSQFVTYRQYHDDRAVIQSDLSYIKTAVTNSIFREGQLRAYGFNRAWERTLDLAKATEVERKSWKQPKARIYDEKRFIPGEGGTIFRLCGTTMPYLTASRDISENLAADVSIYVLPSEAELIPDILVHEFLHFVWMQRCYVDAEFWLQHPDSEAWIDSLIPSVCPGS